MFAHLRRSVAFPLLLALALPLRMAAAADAAVEARLDRLEEELRAVRAENAALRAQLGADAPARVRAAGRELELSLGGYAQLNAEFGDAPDARFDTRDRFLLRRARFGIRGRWKEPVSFKIEADFGNNSLAAKSGYSAQLTDAFVDYALGSALQLRLGQFKTPFGYEQLTADTKLLTIERSLANDRLTLGRQIGLGASGHTAEERVSYSVGVFNGNGANQGFNDNDQFLFAARAAIDWLPQDRAKRGLTLASGLNAFTTDDRGSSFAGQRKGLGADIQATLGSWTAQAEWLTVESDPQIGADARASGWNVLLAWALPDPHWQVLTRFESYDANAKAGGHRSETTTFGVIYRLLGDDLRINLNYLLGDPAGTQGVSGRLLSSVQLIF